tara:strand:- start:920 stop:2440 length:1521 start_codon:yes stop_codon:yes gene_type:complete
MANLVQIAEELEYMPKDQLAQMTQDPNSTYPQFLVLSEIQRRTQLERAYQAQAEGMGPQTTVAEETVAEFMGPQGLQGMAEQPMPQDMQPPMQQPMAESPMQMAANGGRTGFMQGGISTRGSLLNTMGIEHTGMTEQEMGNLIGGINREEEQAPRSFGLMDREIVPEISEPETDMMADGGRTGFLAGGNMPFGGGGLPDEDQDIYESTKKALADRYMDADGTINWSRVGADGLSAGLVASYFTPVGAVRGALGLGLRGLGSVGKLFSSAGREGIKKSLGRTTAKINPRMIKDPKTGQFRSQAAIGEAAISSVAKPLAIGSGIAYLQSDGEETITEDKIETPAEMQARIRKEEQDKYQKQLNQLKDLTEGKTKKSGLFSNISQDQGLTIAQLGGVLMGAKNMSELGTGIAGVAGQAQDRRSSAGLAGAQEAYYEGQVRKIDSEIADMPKEAIREQMSMIIKASEAGLITDIKLANTKYAALEKRLALLEGQETKPASQDANVIASYG